MIQGKSERINTPDSPFILIANHVKDPCVILYPKREKGVSGPATLNPTEARQLVADLVHGLRLLGEYPN